MKKNNYLTLCTLLSITLSGCNVNNVPSQPSDVVDISSDVESSSDLNSSLESESASESTLDVSSEPSIESISESESTSESEVPDDTYSYDIEVDENFDFDACGFKVPTVEEKKELPEYSPVTFDASSYKTTTTKLSEGVDLVVANYSLNNGAAVSPNCIVVDLNKANIVAGSNNNTVSLSEYGTLSTPISQVLAWQRDNSDKKFVAVTNADFFGGGKCVNAFVKDGMVLKSAHNYDMNDIPESYPMLFGVSKAGARIAPISTFTSVESNLKSTITKNGITFYNSDGSFILSNAFSSDTGLNVDGLGVITTTNRRAIPTGATVYMFKKIQNEKNSDTELRGCIVKKVTGVTSVEIKNENFGYIVVGSKCSYRFHAGEYFALIKDSVLSAGGMWNYYDTILGARHSLVENGYIPATVEKETSNGAKSRVPRTAVGITSDGKVVIVSVEDLHYGGKATTCTGLSLTQLADFMRYFGCYDAANFDGGGSSQLITNDNGNYTVHTRSSDTGSSTPESTRKVLNTIIVTTK